ncbi:MAG TPA: 16S rRNA (cytidine(1402)-2'-O)-methyltransferase [Anaerolineaceae bacterium]|nr:16S rRNA (cytidine(1402)-2'-O)-methyltransferase [Anaerolineaceae bacterium]
MTLNANSTTAKPAGKLYVVATPIGNAGDITTRAIETLAHADVILCEEHRNGSRLLKSLGIAKPLLELNEHNEAERIQEVLLMLAQGQTLALISDCGTPVFSDPGKKLLQLLYEMNIAVTPLPGASSLMAALSVCPFDLEEFLFIGFLPVKTDQRQKKLSQLKYSNYPLVLMDTPYRMQRLLQEVQQSFGKKQNIFLACDLTMPEEHLYLGPVDEILTKIQNRKAEFILILDRPQKKSF